MAQICLFVVLFTVLGFLGRLSTASSFNHRYNKGDHVPLFVNKVGPLNNPSETYQYYDLPFCRPDPVIQKRATLGEILNGDRLANTLYAIKFREDSTSKTLCEKKLSPTEVARFRDAVRNDYYFQMYYDLLPLWGYIGKIEGQSWISGGKVPKYYLFTHVHFDALYKGDQIVEINALSDPNQAMEITDNSAIDVKFTYSISWNRTFTQFEKRMNKYLRAAFLPISQKIHWFSFLNSIAITMLLMALVTLLFLRRLRNDMRNSSGIEEEDREVGWKYLHGDVFRYPRNISLFSAVLAVGTQLLTLVCFLFLLAFVGILYPYSRGALFTAMVLVYALTSVVAGYSAASFHCQFAESGWERSVFLTGILFLGPLFVIVSTLNTVAMSYGTTAALPLGTIVVILVLYIFITVPLLAFGGVIGHRLRSEFQAPCAVKRVPREIPPVAWYRKLPCQMFIAGFLTFSAVLLELHQLYASMWGYKIFTFPGILFVTFMILLLLTAILSISLTYIQLSAEDHQWWWRSVFTGGSTAIFIFGYGIYFFTRSNMSNFLQRSFFMGYNACMCYGFFLMLGMISFRASFGFVRRIYDAVKSE